MLEAFPSIDTPIARDLLAARVRAGLAGLPRASRAARVAAGGRRVRRAIRRACGRGAACADRARRCLLHGDIRADNLFFDGDRMKVVDFQFAVARCRLRVDIAYLVSQGLPTEVRRGHDEVLVREYLECLAAHGVGDYAFDEAWRHYRFAVAYLMVLPVDRAARLGRDAGAIAARCA